MAWALSSCSLIRSPEKTVERVQDRFLDAAMDTVAVEKLGGGSVRYLEPVKWDPGVLGVGDLVVVRRIGKGDNVTLEPLFSIGRTVFEDPGMSGKSKRQTLGRMYQAMCHQTPFSTAVEVSRRELKKAAKLDSSDQLEDIRDEGDGLKGGMQFGLAGTMNELKPSFLEELYGRLSAGRTGGRYTPGLNHFTGKLKKQLDEAIRRVSSGGEVYAIGRVVTVDLVTGAIVPKEGDADLPMELRASAADGFGRLLVPHSAKVEKSLDIKSGQAEFHRNERFCWAVTGYRVSVKSGKLEVDPNIPMEW